MQTTFDEGSEFFGAKGKCTGILSEKGEEMRKEKRQKNKMTAVTLVLSLLLALLAGCGGSEKETTSASAETASAEDGSEENGQTDGALFTQWLDGLEGDEYVFYLWNQDAGEGRQLENGQSYEMENDDRLVLYTPEKPKTASFMADNDPEIESYSDHYMVFSVPVTRVIRFESEVATDAGDSIGFYFILVPPGGLTPDWYMDSEGIKNEELGMKIRKDNSEGNRLWLHGGFTQNELHYDSSKPAGGLGTVSGDLICGYYEGDLDSFMAENPYHQFTEKGSIGGLEYAYGKDEAFSDVDVVFVGNGIYLMLSSLSVEEKDIESYLNTFMKAERESDASFLAYSAEDGFHCPALGIEFLYLGLMGEFAVRCDNGEKGMTIAGDSYAGDVFRREESEDIETALQRFVDSYTEADYGSTTWTEAGEDVKKTIGKIPYQGRGVQSDHYDANDQRWIFLSDETPWIIMISFFSADGGVYEDYTNVIEKLN